MQSKCRQDKFCEDQVVYQGNIYHRYMKSLSGYTHLQLLANLGKLQCTCSGKPIPNQHKAEPPRCLALRARMQARVG